MLKIEEETANEHLLRLRRIASGIRENRPGPYELVAVAENLTAAIDALEKSLIADVTPSEGEKTDE